MTSEGCRGGKLCRSTLTRRVKLVSSSNGFPGIEKVEARRPHGEERRFSLEHFDANMGPIRPKRPQKAKQKMGR